MGKWEFPGGKVEYFENFLDTAVRELKEELNIKIDPIEAIGAKDFINKKDGHFVAILVLAKYISGDIKICEKDKCMNFAWVSFDEIKSIDFVDYCKEDIEYILKLNDRNFFDSY